MKDGASQFQNFRVNFHRFHALFFTRLSQLGYARTSFAQTWFRKCSWERTNIENVVGFYELFLDTTKMAMNFSIT
jgi:hypothetical protein